LRDSHDKFEANGIKLYAVSYDDREALAEFARAQRIPFTLLSDVDSAVIKRYGILNTQVSPDDAFLYGIPYPGIYLCGEAGRVSAKFFHDTYKKRDSPEILIDAALGRVTLEDDAPRSEGGDDEVRVTAAIRGGKGTLRQGILRQLVVRFELAEGLHIPVAISAVELLTSSEHRLVKQCPGPHCGWLFLDESRNRTRRWCSMQICGNRTKARLHYARNTSQ